MRIGALSCTLIYEPKPDSTIKQRRLRINRCHVEAVAAVQNTRAFKGSGYRGVVIEKSDQAVTRGTLQQTTAKLSRISRKPKYNFHDQPDWETSPSLSRKRVLFMLAMSRGEQANNGDGNCDGDCDSDKDEASAADAPVLTSPGVRTHLQDTMPQDPGRSARCAQSELR